MERSELTPCDLRRHQRNLTWHFSNQGSRAWTDSFRREFRLGLSDWWILKDADGFSMFSSTETVSEGIPVLLGDYNTSSVICSGGNLTRFQMSAQFSPAPDSRGLSHFGGQSAHEVGHAYGQSHAGLQDAFFGGNVTMLGCPKIFYDPSDPNILSSDDLGAAHWHTETSPSPVSANPSFEYGHVPWYMWGAGSGTTLTHVAGGARGHTYGRIYWSASAGLGQARALARANIVAASGMAAKIMARTSAVGVGGTTIYLQTRGVNHPNTGCPADYLTGAPQWSSGRTHNYAGGGSSWTDDPDDPGFVTNWVTRWSTGCTLTSTWTACETPTAGEFYPNSTTPYDGMDGRLYINSNRQTVTGEPIPVDIDFARLTAPH